MGTGEVISVVIDTNVVISALLFSGKPGKLAPLWKEGKILPYLSQEIIDEYLRVLTYPKFELDEKEIEYLVYREILPYFKIAVVKKRPKIVVSDPSDDKFLHCAIAARAEAVISGDRHLLALTVHEQIPILTVDQFFEKY